MIIHARVDERLIHGQVAMVWTNFLKADRLYVVNDDAWQNEIVLGALQLARPAGKNVTVSSVRRAVVNFKHDKYKDENVFVITKNIADMKVLVEELGLTMFNVGNISKVDGSTQIKNSVSLTPEDIANLKEMVDNGVNITARMVPGEPDDSIMKFIK